MHLIFILNPFIMIPRKPAIAPVVRAEYSAVGAPAARDRSGCGI